MQVTIMDNELQAHNVHGGIYDIVGVKVKRGGEVYGMESSFTKSVLAKNTVHNAEVVEELTAESVGKVVIL